jgi:membrane protein
LSHSALHLALDRGTMSRSAPTEAARTSYEALTRRLPPRLRSTVDWLLSQWPGRIVVRVAAATRRIELFDRSMTIAAQFFTSIFPILIALALWVGNTGDLAEALGVPEQTQSLLDEALAPSSTHAAFGIIGILLVLASATSLSRALTRAFAAIWELPRPTITLTSAWRWVAVVVALVLALLAAHGLTRLVSDLPPATMWQLLASITCDVVLGVFVPWILLAGRVRPRHLLPGAAFFGLAMTLVRPASQAWLPHALDLSAARYGSIGVAFTYLASLYVISFCFLAAGVLGQVVTTDPGWFGRWIEGHDLAAGCAERDPGSRPGP